MVPCGKNPKGKELPRWFPSKPTGYFIFKLYLYYNLIYHIYIIIYYIFSVESFAQRCALRTSQKISLRFLAISVYPAHRGLTEINLSHNELTKLPDRGSPGEQIKYQRPLAVLGDSKSDSFPDVSCFHAVS